MDFLRSHLGNLWMTSLRNLHFSIRCLIFLQIITSNILKMASIFLFFQSIYLLTIPMFRSDSHQVCDQKWQGNYDKSLVFWNVFIKLCNKSTTGRRSRISSWASTKDLILLVKIADTMFLSRLLFSLLLSDQDSYFILTWSLKKIKSINN